MRTILAIIAVLFPVASAAHADTRWIINDADQAKAVRIATEQAAQKAAADRSCYLPAEPRLCRQDDGLWSCRASNPASAASCGKRGKWKRALPAG
jgi:hypothetical protein